MKLASGLPSGVRALLFESAERRRAAEGLCVAVLGAAGFREAILPVLDYFAPYEPILGASARAELYRFADRAGELLALRADFTPQLARLLAPHLPELPDPLRIFYRGDVVRAGERFRRAEREVYQLGGEILGVRGPQLEAEALAALAGCLAALAPPGLRLVVGLAGVLETAAVAAVGAAAAPELAAAIARRERAAARLAGEPFVEILDRGVPARAESLGERAAADLARLGTTVEHLAAAFPGLPVTIDLAEFADWSTLADGRGAERDLRGYYDGLVVRAYARGAARPVASGGRYDRLFAALGAPRAAIGFSLDLDALAALAESVAPAAAVARVAEVPA
ncbi:MAG: ATP phosphoribosyltransferase regulatory subunit [Thermoanaerobaculia bacterium]